jgi:hypothetical protein
LQATASPGPGSEGTAMTQTTTQKPIDRFLPLLKGVKSQHYNGRGNPGSTACCPAYNDSEASLLVWEDTSDHHVGIKCFAGCTRKAIVEAVGLTESDLYTDGKTHSAPKGVTIIFGVKQTLSDGGASEATSSLRHRS